MKEIFIAKTDMKATNVDDSNDIIDIKKAQIVDVLWSDEYSEEDELKTLVEINGNCYEIKSHFKNFEIEVIVENEHERNLNFVGRAWSI